MGVKTRGVLIQEALELAGNTSLAPRAEQWMDMALMLLSIRASWPFLLKRTPVAVPISSTSFVFGNGTGTTHRVFKINRVTYAGAGGARGELNPLVPEEDMDAGDDPGVVSVQSGMPSVGYLGNVTDAFDWRISFNCPVSSAMTFVVAHQIVHAPLTSDNDKPLFPNDRTILQALIVESFTHQKDPRRLAELQVLEGMISVDASAFLKTNTTEPNIGLARHVPTGSRGRGGWPTG